jgi:K+-transporting ATPase ATPase B chain
LSSTSAASSPRCCGCSLTARAKAQSGFILAVALWLWFTVLFANFAEAMAEGRSKAQAASLRGPEEKTWAKKLRNRAMARHRGAPGCPEAENLRKGDVVLVEAGDMIPPTAKSSKAWPRWTRAPSPANRRR